MNYNYYKLHMYKLLTKIKQFDKIYSWVCVCVGF